MAGPAKPIVARVTPAEERDRRRYEIEEAARTLTRAEQIKRDDRLMADVRAMATDLKKVAGLAPAEEKKPERRASQADHDRGEKRREVKR